MAITTKKLGIYTVAGVVFAAIIIAAVFTTGVQLPSADQLSGNNDSGQDTVPLASNMGTLRVLITDAPADLSELWVTIDELEINGDSGWTQLPLTDEAKEPFDLLLLQGISDELTITQLPVGTYTKMRLHVKEATAIFADVDAEGETATESVPLKVPSGKLDIVIKFEIVEGDTTQVLIDMQPDNVQISQSHNLRPVLKATIISPSPTSSPTSESLVTNEPTQTEEPAPTEEPTATPTPTEEPTPTITEEPSPTPTSTESSQT